MKNAICTFLLAQLMLFSVHSQSSYYYTFETKKPLYLNTSSFSVSFTQEVDWQKITKSHPLIKEIHGHTHRPVRSIIIDLKEESNLSLQELGKHIFPNSDLVKDMHWGFEINPELTFWLNDELLYQPSDSWNEKAVSSLLLKYPDAILQQNELGLYSIKVSHLSHSLLLANELVESGMVNWAQPNFMGGFRLFHTPTDPKYPEQYSFHNTGQSISGTNWTPDMDVNAPEAWDLTLGSSSIKIGIIDEGVEAHEDLEDGMGNSRLLPGYPLAPAGNGEAQYDHEGHGQAVAGLIAAEHNNLGIAGMAPNSQLVSAYISVLSTTPISDGVNGMRYLWKTAQVDIINNSYGFKSPDPNLHPALVSEIDSAQIKGRGGLGCVMLFSTGENSSGNTFVNFPANRPNVLSVGSVDGNGTVPSYAPFGPTVDIVVPSAGAQSNVRSIDRMDNATNSADKVGLKIGNYIDCFGGTSSSCAIASGIAALVLSVDPSLTYTEVESIFHSTAIDLGSLGRDDSTGFGLVRADAAVSFALGSFPVEWLDVKGELQEEQIFIEWTTAMEQNNAFFEIQRSSGASFQKLGELPGAGSSNELNSYSFTDTDPLLGNNYYRIKQVDIDGKFSYSPIINISRTQVNELTLSEVYPNPAKSSIFFDYALPRGNEARVDVLDIKGRVIQSETISYQSYVQQLEIQVNSWTPGMYVLVIRNKKGTLSSKRFLVQP